MTTHIRNIAIVGAGAMGAMYASHFAVNDFDVRFIAGGQRAERLKDGVLVNGNVFHIPVVRTDAPTDWVADLVIFAVKDRHLEAAVDEALPVIGDETIVLSVLNGLDSEARIASRLRTSATVLLCIALAMDAERVGGEIRFRQAGKLAFGEPKNEVISAEVERVQEALTRAGLQWDTPRDMLHSMWWKFMVNVGTNQASAVLDAPYGAFQQDGPARSLMMALIDEVVAVARAEGVSLGDEDIAQWHRVLDGQPPEGRTSMHQDVLAGRPTEVDMFAGRVVELGAAHGIPTPVNQTMLWILTHANHRAA